jgi:hypothetical protein
VGGGFIAEPAALNILLSNKDRPPKLLLLLGASTSAFDGCTGICLITVKMALRTLPSDYLGYLCAAFNIPTRTLPALHMLMQNKQSPRMPYDTTSSMYHPDKNM